MTRAEDNAASYEDQSAKVLPPLNTFDPDKNLKIDVNLPELRLPNFEVLPSTA
jgi:hypothetical protein